MKNARSFITIIFLGTLLTCTLGACSNDDNEVEIPLSAVPADIISIIQNALPGITLTEAEKEVKDNVTVYELEGKLLTGEEYEIKITATGTLLKIELED